MAGIKKLKVGNPELAKILIDKMLEKHGIDYDYVIANPQIDGSVWCSHYDWTQEESDNYKKWWIDFFQNNVSPRRSKKLLEIHWQWFNLQYGLRIKDEQ
jgi:hypothetical protein